MIFVNPDFTKCLTQHRSILPFQNFKYFDCRRLKSLWPIMTDSWKVSITNIYNHFFHKKIMKKHWIFLGFLESTAIYFLSSKTHIPAVKMTYLAKFQLHLQSRVGQITWLSLQKSKQSSTVMSFPKKISLMTSKNMNFVVFNTICTNPDVN